MPKVKIPHLERSKKNQKGNEYIVNIVKNYKEGDFEEMIKFCKKNFSTMVASLLEIKQYWLNTRNGVITKAFKKGQEYSFECPNGYYLLDQEYYLTLNLGIS